MIYTKNKEVWSFLEKKCCAPPALWNQTCSPSPSHGPWLGWDIAGMPRHLPAVWGRREQQQQLPGRGSEPTAPSRRAKSTSLVLAGVCALCCLRRLKMTASSHLKQRPVGAVSYVSTGTLAWWKQGTSPPQAAICAPIPPGPPGGCSSPQIYRRAFFF